MNNEEEFINKKEENSPNPEIKTTKTKEELKEDISNLLSLDLTNMNSESAPSGINEFTKQLQKSSTEIKNFLKENKEVQKTDIITEKNEEKIKENILNIFKKINSILLSDIEEKNTKFSSEEVSKVTDEEINDYYVHLRLASILSSGINMPRNISLIENQTKLSETIKDLMNTVSKSANMTDNLELMKFKILFNQKLENNPNLKNLLDKNAEDIIKEIQQKKAQVQEKQIENLKNEIEKSF